MKQTLSSTFSVLVCVVFSKAVLPALQIPVGFWSDLFSWLVSPLASLLTVQMCRKMVQVLKLNQRACKLLEEIRQSWVGHCLESWLSALLSDVTKSIGSSGPDSASSSGMEFQRFLKELELGVTHLVPGTFLLSYLSKLKTSIDHDLQQGVSRE